MRIIRTNLKFRIRNLSIRIRLLSQFFEAKAIKDVGVLKCRALKHVIIRVNTNESANREMCTICHSERGSHFSDCADYNNQS